jgi:hypothetical protein
MPQIVWEQESNREKEYQENGEAGGDGFEDATNDD